MAKKREPKGLPLVSGVAGASTGSCRIARAGGTRNFLSPDRQNIVNALALVKPTHASTKQQESVMMDSTKQDMLHWEMTQESRDWQNRQFQAWSRDGARAERRLAPGARPLIARVERVLLV